MTILELALQVAILGSASAMQLHCSARRFSRSFCPAMAEQNVLPERPVAGMTVEDTVHAICGGLQGNDTPSPDAGIERLFNFLTPAGRVAIAPVPPKAGAQGGVTLEYFLENAASKAIGSLMFCEKYALIGEPRITPGTNFRGQLATQVIEVGNSPLEDETDEVATLRALSAAPDEFLQGILHSVREGTPMPKPPDEALVRARFWVSLEQERRPPNQDCWFVKELMPLKKTKFQEMNEGGEEFEGDDSG